MTNLQLQAKQCIETELTQKTQFLFWSWIRFNIRLFVSERMKEQQQNG